jgi:hypothetical protein
MEFIVKAVPASYHDRMRAFYILVKMIALCIKFSFLMRVRNVQFCLQVCEKPGFLNSSKDMAYADKCIRRFFKLFHPNNPCLVHCFALAQSATSHLKMYFSISSTGGAPQHAYVKYHNLLFSTAEVQNERDNLLVWSKGG